MDWAHEYVPGQVRASCSICGCSRRFPDNLTYCVDKLFRCERCMETTAMELDQRIQAYRMQPDEPDSRVGLTPFGDTPQTFLADSTANRLLAIPGWTPTSTLSDDFTVLPGAIGSAWTTVLAGTGTVTAASGGGVRLSAGTSSALAYASATSVPLPSAGRFYSRFRFAFATPNGNSTVGVSTTVAGVPSALGAKHSLVALTTFPDIAVVMGFSLVRTAPVRSYIESLATFHIGEMWWNGDGYVRFRVDGVAQLTQAPLASQVLSNPVPSLVAAANSSGVVEVTNFVCFT